jgi:hypothetical protein
LCWQAPAKVCSDKFSLKVRSHILLSLYDVLKFCCSMFKLSDSSPLGLNIFDIGISTKSTSLSALAKSSFLRQKSPDLGHSVKMSFYCRILYIKFFDYGVSLSDHETQNLFHIHSIFGDPNVDTTPYSSVVTGTPRKNVSMVQKSRKTSVEQSFFAECPCAAL